MYSDFANLPVFSRGQIDVRLSPLSWTSCEEAKWRDMSSNTNMPCSCLLFRQWLLGNQDLVDLYAYTMRVTQNRTSRLRQLGWPAYDYCLCPCSEALHGCSSDSFGGTYGREMSKGKTQCLIVDDRWTTRISRMPIGKPGMEIWCLKKLNLTYRCNEGRSKCSITSLLLEVKVDKNEGVTELIWLPRGQYCRLPLTVRDRAFISWHWRWRFNLIDTRSVVVHHAWYKVCV